MDSILKRIQNTVIKYAHIISQVLKVDIEIVDSNLIRIAGTGKYMDVFDICVKEEAHIYSKALESGKTQVIENPGEHEICSVCSYRCTCIEKLVASTPIKMDGEVIGVIGLICFSDEQRSQFIDNFSAYFSFLEQISEFIATKAYETLESERSETMVMLLNSIMEKLDDAIIVISRDGLISHMNKEAAKILHIDTKSKHSIKLEPTGNYILDQQEYELKLKGFTYLVAGIIHGINIKTKQYDKIFIFSETKTLKNKIFHITNTDNKLTIEDILGESNKISALKKKVTQISKSSSTILITGESGTGKEMFARAIHSESTRKDHPFVAINCGAVPDTLLESELFGYVKGAFTGATQTGKIGKFEFANSGTIFLDEVGDMPLYMQVKLLRVLQDKEVVKIGSNKPTKLDVRVIAATNKNLEQMITNGSFRKDLYYRLNVIPIEVPALRERREDIKMLISHFTKKYADLFNKNFVSLDSQVLRKMLAYDWPGNIRELENTVEFMINMMDSSGIITLDILPHKFSPVQNHEHHGEIEETLELTTIEKDAIKKALIKYGNTTEGKTIVAEKLGIGLSTLYRKILKYNL